MFGSLLARTLVALTTLVAIASAVLLGGPSSAAPAAPETPRTWNSDVTTVCVQSNVGREWHVKQAVREWNRLDGGPTFVLKTSCPDYDDSVSVRYRNEDDVFTGWTEWFWDASGDLIHADVTLNPERIKAFAPRDRTCMRRHTITHELGHALGLRHYPHAHAGAVMSYLDWQQRCGRLDAHDRSDFRGLYPR